MSYMISSQSNFHWVRRVSAETNTPGALKLTLHGDEGVNDIQFNSAEVLIFMDDPALVSRLVAAINGVNEPKQPERPKHCRSPDCNPADQIEGRCCGWVESVNEPAVSMAEAT